MMFELYGFKRCWCVGRSEGQGMWKNIVDYLKFQESSSQGKYKVNEKPYYSYISHI